MAPLSVAADVGRSLPKKLTLKGGHSGRLAEYPSAYEEVTVFLNY